MSEKEICPIILAAGKSQRFGSDKLLHVLPYNGNNKPLILHSLMPWLDVFDHINVVVRSDNHALIQMLADSELVSRLTLIKAINPEKGMSASLVSGIEANRTADGWLIGLSDMPFIQSSVIIKSLEALNTGAEITLPTYNGKRGHPVGFSSVFCSQLLALSGDKGAKEIIASSPDNITFIDSPDDGICQDIDTRENLEGL
jgi:molybdenum cofactor cytidylyltransferase